MAQHSFWAVHLEGLIAPLANGHFKFTSADIRVEYPHFSNTPEFGSRFMYLHYTIDDKQQPKTLRLDMDKRAIIDETGDKHLDTEIRKRAAAIWETVVKERRRQRPETLAPEPV